jgi:hypothetical protein
MKVKKKRDEIMSIFFYSLVDYRQQQGKDNKCFQQLVKFFDEDSDDEEGEDPENLKKGATVINKTVRAARMRQNVDQ